jgi:arylsulfatase A-like enzyme
MPVDERPFFYFNKNDLEAIRVGNWKLHFSKMGKAQPLLFDLVQDPSESTDLLGQMPNVVEKLAAMAAKARTQFGDRRMDMIGSEVRPIGSVASPRMLTEFDPNHPYYVSEYDLADRG